MAFILSANLARRHMTKGQRAMAGVMTVHSVDSTREVSKVVGIGREFISRARQVLDADIQLADQVLNGTIPLNEAYGIGLR